MKNKIVNYTSSGVIFATLIWAINFLWYSFAPLAYWIEYDSITLMDKKQ